MQILHSECSSEDNKKVTPGIKIICLRIVDKRKSKILEDLTEKKPITGKSWTGIVSNNTEYSKLKQGLTED